MTLFIFIPILFYFPWIINWIMESFLYCPTHYDESYHGGKFLKTINDHKIPFMIIKPTGIEHPSKCIVYSHGNIGCLLNDVEYWNWYANQLEVCVVLYDYIGFGISREKPSEENCYQSLDMIIEYVCNELKYSKEQIYLIGYSLGTAIVANYVAKNYWTTPIMMISPFKSILRSKIDFGIKIPFDKFKTYEKIDKIKCPVKIVHGKYDTIVPFRNGVAIYAAIPNKKLNPIWMNGIGHFGIMENLTVTDYSNFLELLN